MKFHNRLVVEWLENRWCPAVTATLKSATLTITGAADNGSIRVVQDSTTVGTVAVFDGTTSVGSFSGVNNLRLNLGSAADTVFVDLGGKSLSGGIVANLGAGKNALSVVNGGVSGRLSVTAGDDDDTVTLGGTAALSLKTVHLDLFGGTDTVTVQSQTSVTGSLATLYANNVTLAPGSTTNNVILRGGTGGNTILVAGDVTGDLVVDTYFRSGSSAATSLEVTGQVDGNVFINSSDQADSITIAGSIGKSLALGTHGGDDKIAIRGAVTRTLSVDSGAGNDGITLSNAVGGRTAISAGAGNDSLNLTATAKLQGYAVVTMGAGTDTVILDDAATIATLLINGGTGSDTFTGTKSRSGLTLISLELP